MSFRVSSAGAFDLSQRQLTYTVKLDLWDSARLYFCQEKYQPLTMGSAYGVPVLCLLRQGLARCVRGLSSPVDTPPDRGGGEEQLKYLLQQDPLLLLPDAQREFVSSTTMLLMAHASSLQQWYSGVCFFICQSALKTGMK